MKVDISRITIYLEEAPGVVEEFGTKAFFSVELCPLFVNTKNMAKHDWMPMSN